MNSLGGAARPVSPQSKLNPGGAGPEIILKDARHPGFKRSLPGTPLGPSREARAPGAVISGAARAWPGRG